MIKKICPPNAIFCLILSWKFLLNIKSGSSGMKFRIENFQRLNTDFRRLETMLDCTQIVWSDRKLIAWKICLICVVLAVENISKYLFLCCENSQLLDVLSGPENFIYYYSLVELLNNTIFDSKSSLSESTEVNLSNL